MATMQAGRNNTGFPSVDKPWTKYYSSSEVQNIPSKCTLYQNIVDRNIDYPNDIAINYFGNKISFSKMFDIIDHCSKSLLQIGMNRGDCVTLCTVGVPEAIYLVLACSRIGAIANFINPLFTKEQMVDRINETNAEWIFILDEMYSFIKEALPETCIKHIVIIPATKSIPVFLSKILYYRSKAIRILSGSAGMSQQVIVWNNFLAIGKKYIDKIDVPFEPDTPTVMVYSSGTTGASKGILLTNEGILATNYCRNLPPDPVERQKTFLQMIPIWFSTGIVISIMIPLLNGCTVIPEPKFSKESFAKDLVKYKPNMTLTATSLWLYAAGSKYTKDVDFSFMECPITGGEKVSGEDEKTINSFLRDHGCPTGIFKGYGMCELGGTVTSTSDAVEYKSKACGAGYPIHDVIVSAFNIDTNEELKYGEHGEIRVCSPAHMKGYYKNPEATMEFFKTDSEGRVWGRTGDIGYVDEDGEVFILGRATDSFRRENGEIVYLFDIEEEIFKDESVNQCKVIDITEEGKRKLVAHIVFKDGDTDNLEKIKRIASILSDRLPDYMLPDYYKIRSSMPVHSNGKRDVGSLRIDREDLRSTARFS